MSQNARRVIVPLILVVGVVCTLLLIVSPPLLAHAGGGPGGGAPGLPPRHPPPTQPTHADDDDEDTPIGAYIELQARSAPPETWTVVQWQDKAGGWHDVEGWQGTLEPDGSPAPQGGTGAGRDGSKRWWVAAKDFGTGPFRWIVTQGKNGRPLAASAWFNLPSVANETVRIEVEV